MTAPLALAAVSWPVKVLDAVVVVVAVIGATWYALHVNPLGSLALVVKVTWVFQ